MPDEYPVRIQRGVKTTCLAFGMFSSKEPCHPRWPVIFFRECQQTNYPTLKIQSDSSRSISFHSLPILFFPPLPRSSPQPPRGPLRACAWASPAILRLRRTTRASTSSLRPTMGNPSGKSMVAWEVDGGRSEGRPSIGAYITCATCIAQHSYIYIYIHHQ